MEKNRVCEILNIKYPIVQAAMAWLTDAKLVSAVSNAGGMGVLAANAGYNTLTTDPVETAERMRKVIRQTRELTDKPFAINIQLMPEGAPDPFTPEILKVVYEEDVKYILALGMSPLNEKMMKEFKDRGRIIIYRDLDPTVEGAKKAEACGADIIIATGFDEGGGIPARQISAMSMIPMIADAVSVPVLGAGGIVDVRGVRAAFALGAEGVYMGTRFVASTECPASDVCKQDVINSTADDLVIFRGLPNYWRSTRHKLAMELLKMSDEGVPAAEINKKMGSAGSIRIGMLNGDLDNGINSLNTAIDLIKEVKSCAEIIDEVMVDFK